jgi:hypothetical protein
VNPRKASERDCDAPELVVLDLAAINIPPGTPEADTSRGRDANRVLAMKNEVNLISPVAGGNSKKDDEAGTAGAVVLGVGDFIQPESTGREHLADLELCPEETAAEAASSRLLNLSDFGSTDLGVILTCPMGHAPDLSPTTPTTAAGPTSTWMAASPALKKRLPGEGQGHAGQADLHIQAGQSRQAPRL